MLEVIQHETPAELVYRPGSNYPGKEVLLSRRYSILGKFNFKMTTYIRGCCGIKELHHWDFLGEWTPEVTDALKTFILGLSKPRNGSDFYEFTPCAFVELAFQVNAMGHPIGYSHANLWGMCKEWPGATFTKPTKNPNSGNHLILAVLPTS
jgi:hypothetical protein